MRRVFVLLLLAAFLFPPQVSASFPDSGQSPAPSASETPASFASLFAAGAIECAASPALCDFDDRSLNADDHDATIPFASAASVAAPAAMVPDPSSPLLRRASLPGGKPPPLRVLAG